MERLNKRQKEILIYLGKIFPKDTNYDSLVKEFGSKPDDILSDIEILKDKKLIKMLEGTFQRYICISISPKGIEKLKENFITRLTDAIYNNPLKAVSVGIALILGILGLIITIWK